MIEVAGTTHDGIAYRVGLHDAPTGQDSDGAVGCVMGSTHVVALVRAAAGREVSETPTTAPVTVDPADAATVLALLRAETLVQSVTGAGAPTGPDNTVF